LITSLITIARLVMFQLHTSSGKGKSFDFFMIACLFIVFLNGHVCENGVVVNLEKGLMAISYGKVCRCA